MVKTIIKQGANVYPTYPLLKESNGRIVLFSSSNTGTVLTNSSDVIQKYTIGKHYNDIDEGSYKLFTGEIILQNS